MDDLIPDGTKVRLKPTKSHRNRVGEVFHVVHDYRANGGRKVAVKCLLNESFFFNPDEWVEVEREALEVDYERVPLVVHATVDRYDFYLGRANSNNLLPESPLANPFVVKTGMPRIRAIELYAQDLSRSATRLSLLPLLRGKRVSCWCKTKGDPEQACHGDVIVELLRLATDDQIRLAVTRLLKENWSWPTMMEAFEVVRDRETERLK